MNQEVKTINGYSIKDEKAIRTYDSVASMKADTKLSEGQHVKTRGYYEVNDGGSAEYIIKSNVVLNEYKENLNNGKYAVLITNEKLNIKQFGAYGDKIHNDTSAIQNAINFAQDNEIVKTLFIPIGTYLVSHLEITKPINIIGESQYDSILWSIDNNTNNSLIEIINDGCWYNIFSNFRLYGNMQNENGMDGILVNITQDNISDRYTNYNNLKISAFTGHGILLNDNLTDYDIREIRIDNIDISGCKKGVYAKGVTDSLFTRITSHSNREEGIYINSANNRIVNCKTFFNGRGYSNSLEDLNRIPYTAFTETSDLTPEQGKTYYTRSGKNYQNDYYKFTEFTGSSFENDVTYYELTTTTYYKRYAGIVINGKRCVIDSCECQDNFGDGIQVLKPYVSINNISCDNNGILIPVGQPSDGESIVSYESQNMTQLYVGVYIHSLTQVIVNGIFNNHRYNEVGPSQMAPVRYDTSSCLSGDITSSNQVMDNVYCENADMKKINISINGNMFEYICDLSDISLYNNIIVSSNDNSNMSYLKIKNGICYFNLIITSTDNVIVPSDSSNRNLITLPIQFRPIKHLHLIPGFSSNEGFDIYTQNKAAITILTNGRVELHAEYVRNYKSAILVGSYPIV